MGMVLSDIFEESREPACPVRRSIRQATHATQPSNKRQRNRKKKGSLKSKADSEESQEETATEEATGSEEDDSYEEEDPDDLAGTSKKPRTKPRVRLSTEENVALEAQKMALKKSTAYFKQKVMLVESLLHSDLILQKAKKLQEESRLLFADVTDDNPLDALMDQ